ncbi:MAG: hypothetical protein GWN79_01020 [Actinobacteria bacterium]|nr:hypothetical protein [Actinomycetota bacterium]NIS28746.1 hypothetical protein [Actinomycetota bacterium]NIT94132.1 hypothetical protein [Actinomycetota bacterium]NIU17757.1 hypothetical protein [Actinomycetota bacterium]NIU64208.1 hypothetical protein [Actinomycetota bacterium]
MNKKLMATAIAASTLGGAAAGAALLAPGQAGAQDDGEPPAGVEHVRPEFGTHIRTALQGLVDDGTLTDAQVDAVVEALHEARPDDGPRFRHRGFRGHRPGKVFGHLAGGEVAEILGLEPEELRDALRDGRTVEELAAEQGIDIEDVVDAIVDAAEARLDQAVENGRIDAERADEMLEKLEERIEAHLSGGTDGTDD